MDLISKQLTLSRLLLRNKMLNLQNSWSKIKLVKWLWSRVRLVKRIFKILMWRQGPLHNIIIVVQKVYLQISRVQMDSLLIHIPHCIKLSQVILYLTFHSHDKISRKEDRIWGKFLKEIFLRIEVHLVIKILVEEIMPITFRWHLNTSNISKLKVKEKQF